MEYCEPGFDVFNVRDSAGRTCLHIAVAGGEEDALKAMAEIGGGGFKAALDAHYGREDAGVTALRLAMMHNRDDILKILIKEGCDLNILSRRFSIVLRRRPEGTGRLQFPGVLQMVAMEGQLGILQTLLEVQKPNVPNDKPLEPC